MLVESTRHTYGSSRPEATGVSKVCRIRHSRITLRSDNSRSIRKATKTSCSSVWMDLSRYTAPTSVAAVSDTPHYFVTCVPLVSSDLLDIPWWSIVPHEPPSIVKRARQIGRRCAVGGGEHRRGIQSPEAKNESIVGPGESGLKVTGNQSDVGTISVSLIPANKVEIRCQFVEK